jgi:hypothetical protein
MRTEVMVAAVLAAGGGTAVAVSSCGGSSKKSSSKAPTPSVAPQSTTAATKSAPAAPRTLAIRVNGRNTRVLIGDIGFAYCRKNPSVCGAIKSSQEGQLTPNQRRAVAAARKTIKEQESAQAPSGGSEAPQTYSPPAEPAPAPVPEPAPEGTSTG